LASGAKTVENQLKQVSGPKKIRLRRALVFPISALTALLIRSISPGGIMESRTAVYLKRNVSVVVAYLSLLILIGDEPQ
jgi:hypothetical protein